MILIYDNQFHIFHLRWDWNQCTFLFIIHRCRIQKPPSSCHGRYFRLSCPITERKNNSRNYYLMIDHTRSIIYLFIDLISFIFFSFEILFFKFFGLFRLKVSSSLFELRKEYGLSKDFLQNNGVMCEMMSFQISSK